MKSILLTTTALVAFAGAAAADGHTGVSFGGDAFLSYNDDIDNGFGYGIGLTLKAAAELNNGLTASITGDITVNRNALQVGDDADIEIEDVVVTVGNDVATLSFGDVSLSADDNWTGVTNMEADNFAEAGDAANDDQTVVKLDVAMGTVSGSFSAVIEEDEDDDGENFQFYSYSLTADLDVATLTFAGQGDADSGDDGADVWGVTAAGTFEGVDLMLSYADDTGADEQSTGVQATYVAGPVSVTGFFVSNSDADNNQGVKVAYAAEGLSVSAFYHTGNDEDAGVDVSYDMGNGLALYAGNSEDDGSYAAAQYDLGGGAALLVAYAEDENEYDTDTGLNEEIGPKEYMHGTTVKLSFKF